MLRLLLDTHALVWWSLDQQKLSRRAYGAIEDGDNEIFFSPVTAMEIATKVRIGKMDFARSLATSFERQMADRGFTELPLLSVHAEAAGGFVSSNNDPWDRLLAAQAKVESLAVISDDSKLGDFGVLKFW